MPDTAEALALELRSPAHWVDDATVDLGEGATAHLRRGLLFPVTAGQRVAGFVFVGAVDGAWPVSGAVSSLTAAGLTTESASGWSTSGDRLVAFGYDDDLVAAAALGRPILDDPNDVVFLDEEGREVVLVTDLHPRSALRDAEDALKTRSEWLAEAGLDPVSLLRREAWREGAEPRSITELRSTAHDLRPLARAVDERADLAPPWATWVVDPTGLVDDAFGGVFGVHGGVPAARVWRALGGAPLRTAAWVADHGVANVVLARGPGTVLEASVEAVLTSRAGERGRLVDLWIPEVEDQPNGASSMVASTPEPVATLADGTALSQVEAPFGPRRVADARLRSFLLPEPVPANEVVAIHLTWGEQWDVGGVLRTDDFVAGAYALPPALYLPSTAGMPAMQSLGKVATGLTVMPRLATGPTAYASEVRVGSTAPPWDGVVGAGAEALPQADGRVWRVRGDAPASFAIGRFESTTFPARSGMPPIRVHRHAPLGDDLLVAVRAILHFYGDALPPWPHDELVIVQGQAQPVLVARGELKPEFDPRYVHSSFRQLGGGMIEFRGLLAIAPTLGVVEPGSEYLIATLPPSRLPSPRRSEPDATSRSLALALALGWWGELGWSDRDAWLPGSIGRLYRDRFTEERWGAKALRQVDRAMDQDIAMLEPADGTAPLTGSSADWATERGGRLLRAVMGRIGEVATLRALDHFRAGDVHDQAQLVAALEREGNVPLAGWFDAFATVGLRPRVTAALDGETLTLTAEPAVGDYELPVRIGADTEWVPMSAGAGSVRVPAGRAWAVDPDGLLPIRVR